MDPSIARAAFDRGVLPDHEPGRAAITAQHRWTDLAGRDAAGASEAVSRWLVRARRQRLPGRTGAHRARRHRHALERIERASPRLLLRHVERGADGSGGEPLAPPLFIARNNRIEDYWTEALALAGAGPVGRSVQAILQANDTTTSFTDTGPNNPFALRIGPVFAGTPFLDGSIDADIKGNRFRGTPRYAIIMNAGQTVLRSDGSRYSGSVATKFADNRIDGTGITGAPALITFTNSRATELPCELDPANSRAECPSLSGNPPQHWDYLVHGLFDLRHSGELDGARIDHPATHPVGDHVLDNLLRINGDVVEHQTFVRGQPSSP